jgi:hypothetical protein
VVGGIFGGLDLHHGGRATDHSRSAVYQKGTRNVRNPLMAGVVGGSVTTPMRDGSWTASLEPIAFVLRLHPGDKGFGSPYVSTSTVTLDEEGTAAVRGLAIGRFPPAAGKAILRAFQKAGFKATSWSRMIDGEKRIVHNQLPVIIAAPNRDQEAVTLSPLAPDPQTLDQALAGIRRLREILAADPVTLDEALVTMGGLREMLAARTLYDGLDFTADEGTIMALLLANPGTSARESLLERLDCDGSGLKLGAPHTNSQLTRAIAHLRCKLAVHGIDIETVYRHPGDPPGDQGGFSMTANDRARMRAHERKAGWPGAPNGERSALVCTPAEPLSK